MKSEFYKNLLIHKLTALLIIIFLTNIMSFAQDEETRINFGRGKSSAEVAGIIPAKRTHTYVLRVRKGQKIKIKVTSGSGKVDVDTSNLSAGQFEESGVTSLNLPVDETGDYRIYVRNFGKTETNYSLTVTVR
jgi:hypothetical protein